MTINDKIMLKLTAKNSYINEILHEINDFKVQRTFVDCKLVCQGGVVQCHAAMLQYANIWWVNCRNSDIDECVIIIPDMTVSEGSNLVDEIYSGSNFENNLMDAVYDYNNNNSVDVENEENLDSSLTRLTTKLQDETLSEDDVVNILEELRQLEVTVPALQETGAGFIP